MDDGPLVKITEEYPLTEEICECPIDHGSVENDHGQIVCEHCGKEIPGDYPGYPSIPMTVPLAAELYRTESPIFTVKLSKRRK